MKAVDLFCGCGGVGLALRECGFSVVGVDNDPDAAAIYREAVGGKVVCADVRTLSPSDFAPATLLWASPPCPPWSEGRRSQGIPSLFAHQDGKLLLEAVRWAREIGPRWVIVENVDAIPAEGLRPLVGELERLYPFVTLLRLNAEGWVAQRRGHVFVVAGPRPVPEPAPPSTPPPRFGDIADGRGAVPVDVQHLQYAVRKRAFGTPIVGPDDPLPTVTTMPYSTRWTCFIVPKPGVVRFPTFVEAARAQGFPDDHPIHRLYRERRTVAWRLLGNAVPVPLARAVIAAVLSGEEEGGC